MIGEEGLVGYSREQIEAARRDSRLERGRGAMVADFGAAIEEVERTRMMGVLGMHELRRAYERERADFDANGGDQQREHEVQVYWQRAELARTEIEKGHPALNAQALISMNSALDALVEEFTPAVRDLPFQIRMKQAEEQVPEAVEHLTPELREKMLRTLQKLLKVPSDKELAPMKGSGTVRYEPRLKQVGLGAPEDRPIPPDLDEALTEFGAIRDVLVHRAGRLDEKALKQALSLRSRYQDGELARLSDEDYRTYSAAIRCYGAEIIHRLWRKWPDLLDPEGEVDLQNWRECHIAGA
jgi:hypothetical protein